MGKEVRAVRRHLDFEHVVGPAESAVEDRAGRVVEVELEDAAAVLSDAELHARADHPLGELAADLRPLDAKPSGEHGALDGDRDSLARADVRRAADDREGTLPPRVDRAETQPVRPGMPAALEHLPEHDPRVRGRERLDPLDVQAEHREIPGELVRALRDIDVPFEPFEARLHPRTSGAASPQNWPRKRRSFARSLRMSSMPYFSMAVRSMPMPKANPV